MQGTPVASSASSVSNELYIVKGHLQTMLDQSTEFKFAFDALLQQLDFDKVERIKELENDVVRLESDRRLKVDQIDKLERENVALKIELEHAKAKLQE